MLDHKKGIRYEDITIDKIPKNWEVVKLKRDLWADISI